MDYRPFKDIIQNDLIIREFNSNIDSSECIWHVDEYDRIVEVIENDGTWMLQFDNELPKILEGVIYIKKNVYHRLIKGDNRLKIKIKEIKDGNS